MKQNYQTLNNFKLIMEYIKTVGICESFICDEKHLAELEDIKNEMKTRGISIKQEGKHISFARA